LIAQCGGTNDITKIRGKGKTQSRLSMTSNMIDANSLLSKILFMYLEKFPINGVNGDGRDNPFFRQFISQRSHTSMRFLNRAHLSNQARGFRPFDLKLIILHRLLIALVPIATFTCTRCGVKDVHYNEHLERCKRMHFRTTNLNGEPLLEGDVRYLESRGRVDALHSELKFLMKSHWKLIPDVIVGKREPHPDLFFPLNELDEVQQRTDQQVAADRDTRADVLITTAFEGDGQMDILVDHTTSSIHVPSNCSHACKKEKLVDVIEKRKDDQYDKWEHHGQIVAFGCDSNGTIGKSAVKLINRLYSKWNITRTQERCWVSEVSRVALKKRFLDNLSVVFAKAQLKDIMLLGQFRRALALRHFPAMRKVPEGINVNRNNINGGARGGACGRVIP